MSCKSKSASKLTLGQSSVGTTGSARAKGGRRSSTALGCAPPILTWTNDWDLIDSLHVEQITIDAH
jgi:hypothetical protein